MRNIYEAFLPAGGQMGQVPGANQTINPDGSVDLPPLARAAQQAGSTVLANKNAVLEAQLKQQELLDKQAEDNLPEETVRAIAEYRLPPPPAISFGKPTGSKLLERVMAVNPQYNAQTYQTMLKENQSFAGQGQNAKNLQALNTVVGHTNDILGYLKNNDNFHQGPMAFLNYPKAWIERAMGDPRISQIQSLQALVGPEIAKVASGAQTGAGEREDYAQKFFNPYQTPEQSQANFEALTHAMAQRMVSMKQEAESNLAPGMGQDQIDSWFKKKLTPQAQNAFNPGSNNPEDVLSGSDLWNAYKAQAAKSGDRILTDPAERFMATGGMKDTPIPPAMQQEYQQLLSKIPRGNLTLPQYEQLVGDLYKKYGYQYSPNYRPVSEAYVKAYNDPVQTVGTELRMGQEPKTLWEKMISGAVGNNPLGRGAGNVAAGTIAAGNAATMGIPELLAGREGRYGLRAMEDYAPIGSTIGDIIGSVAGTEGIGVLGRQGTNLAARLVAKDLGRDMLYSGTRGFNSAEEGQGAQGALLGAGGALLANPVGRFAAAGARGFQSPETRALIDANRRLDLTTLQASGAPDVESIFKSVPGVQGAKQRAVDSWSRQLKSSVLDEAGLPGIPAGIGSGRDESKYVNQQLDQAFTNWSAKANGQVDPTFFSNIAQLISPRSYQDPIQQTLARKLRAVVQPLTSLTVPGQNPAYNGKTIRQVWSTLGQLERDWSGDQTDTVNKLAINNMSQVASDVRDQIHELLARNDQKFGTQFSPEFDQLSSAWSKKMVMDEAGNKAIKEGSISPEDWLRAVRKIDPSVRKGRFAEGTARWQQEGQQGLDLLGSSPGTDASHWGAHLAMLAPLAATGALMGAGSDDNGWRGAAEGSFGLPLAMGAAMYAPGARNLTRRWLSQGIGKDELSVPLSQLIQAMVMRNQGLSPQEQK